MKILHLIITIASIIGIAIVIITSVLILTPEILKNNSEEHLVSMYELTSYPYKYKDKTITLRSNYQGDIHAVEWNHWIKESGQRLYIKLKNMHNCPTLIYDAQYYFTGTFRFLENHSYLSYFLDDTEIKPIEPLPEKPMYSLVEIKKHAYQLLDKEITTWVIYTETVFENYFSDYENLSLIPNAEYYITGYLFIDSKYGFPYMMIRVTEVNPVV